MGYEEISHIPAVGLSRWHGHAGVSAVQQADCDDQAVKDEDPSLEKILKCFEIQFGARTICVAFDLAPVVTKQGFTGL